MKTLRARAALAFVAVVAACTAETLPPKGQLMLVVTSNLAPPKDFDSFHLRIDEDGNDVPIHDVEYAMTGSQATKLPATLGIVVGSDPNRIVRIRVEGLRGGQVRIRRDAIARVPTNRVASLPLPIDGLCVDASCPADANGKAQTCIAGSCQSAEVDVDALPDFSREAIFGGGSGNGDGACFDTLECFSKGHVADKAADCSVAKEVGAGFNVAVIQPTKSDGICAANACLIPLDPDPFTGPIVTGWREANGRVMLPPAICQRSLPVMVTTTCPTKNAPTCGAWSAVGNRSAADASLPIGDAGATDASLPPNVPPAITFLDGDPRERFVDGTITVKRAPDESAITGYAVYWADGPTKKLDLVTTLPKTGADVTHVLSGPMLANATHLVAAATTASGELAPVVQTGPIDNFPRQTSITTNAPEMTQPTLLLDKKNQRILVVGFDAATASTKPALLRCSLDGTGCTYVDISAGTAPVTGGTVVGALIDEKNEKLVVVTDRTDAQYRAQYFRCELDGTGCITKDLGLAIGPMAYPNRLPVMIDTVNDKLIAVNAFNKGTIYRCDLDGTNCTRPSFDPGGAGSNAETALLSPTDAKLLIVRGSGGGAGNVPTLFRCELDGTSCAIKDISATNPLSPNVLAAAIDPVNLKLLVVGHNTNDQVLTWWRCNLDGTNCTTGTVGTQDPQFPYPEHPAIVFDVPHQKLFVFASLQDGTKGIYYRCNFDLTGCSPAQLMATSFSRNPSVVLSDGIFYVIEGRFSDGIDYATLGSY